MQYKAGYIVDSIGQIINDFKSSLNKRIPAEQKQLDQINGLLQYVSSFDIEFPHKHNPDYKKLNPVLATLNNIITRGLPTSAPLSLEKLFSKINLTEPNEEEYEFHFPKSINQIKYETIFELLHIIEPNLEILESNYAGKPGSKNEWLFLHEMLKEYPYSKQILQSQREFATINKNLGGGRSVDFSFEFPYLNSNNSKLKKKGVIFEYDGSFHINSYKYYDNYRDDAASEEGFDTLRQASDKLELDQSIIKQFKKEIFQIFKNNFHKEIKEHHLAEYSLIFIPISVARIHKTIIEFLLVHPDYFSKEKIKVAIVERDLPCGAIAIKTLQELFLNINSILKDSDKLYLPEIELTIFETSKWVLNNELHLQANIQDESFFKQNHFDIIIDHSVLRRSNIYNESDFKNENAIKIRSSHYNDNSFGKARRVYCGDLLQYKSLVRKKDDGSYIPIIKYENSINFFIQNIFRKVGFREGQLPIISRALQQKPVIGLLPTGAGKSLTFQLPSFLQPGLCLVVDPIKSLMEDQVRVLKQNWIDCCDFINSNLKREEKVKKLIDFRYGETMFLFVSPERFVMEDFRNIIYKIDISKFGLAFSYCVIDEVHCVSEWGHDFRSTYLMLGKNSQRFAKTRKDNSVSLIGLTATASFDVLADIERELQIQHNDVADAIIMIENTIRPELFFRVTDVTNKNRINKLKKDFSNIGKNLQKLNNEELIEKSKLHHRQNFNDIEVFSENILFKNETGELIDLEVENQNYFYSIIFCPVKGKKGNEKGVDFVYQKLNSGSMGFFYSSETEEESKKVQEHFENFTAGKTKHIVCTKAFGMGIDKKDIRSTYHYVYSSSLESLVQEAGRSGRDKKISEANILVSKQVLYKLSKDCLLKNNPNSETIEKISDIFHRRLIRKLINNDFSTFESIISEIDKCINSLREWDNGNLVPLNEIKKKYFKDRLSEFIVEKYEDREIHDYFHEGSFKGTDVEFSQFYSLFNDREFNISNNSNEIIYLNDGTLKETFEESKNNETFNFIITSSKEYPDNFFVIYSKLSELPNQKKIQDNFIVDINNSFKKANHFDDLIITTNGDYVTVVFKWFSLNIKRDQKIIEELRSLFKDNKANEFLQYIYITQIQKSYSASKGAFSDFLLLLEERIGKLQFPMNNCSVERWLKFFYSRNRYFKPSNDTGRLIYRMHSMGFLEDYLIDYNKNNLYYCTFKKYNTIDDYVLIIENYLRRYLSENTALENISDLKSRLSKPTLIENIIECLYFLSEFSYKEIASKRKRATDEIESVLNKSITEEVYVNDWYEQNLFIKEQIYFYFNAKYARIGFKINGKPYSLLDDYQEEEISKKEILEKYLEVFRLDGAEQNNYKHMMGSCKKILRSLSETDLNNEWLLRLLKAFAMYSVNNASYISEANEELEKGFDNLYKDEVFHENDFEIIEPIFETYFQKLQSNIQEDNHSFKDIKLIRAKLLLKMQTLGIERLINKNQKLIAQYYA